MISVITPNFNGERWLNECLESVASQSLPQNKVEMLFIDDGSTDGSRSIVDSYRHDIPGLKTVWHEHTGNPGRLRNIGLERAIGDYVLFLDSDDYLGVESLERLTEFSETAPSDVIAFQLEGLDRNVPKSMLKETVVDADIVTSGIYKSLGTWKMCKREYLNSIPLRFEMNQRRGEDALFFSEAMLRAKSISILSGYPFYTLRGREDGSSITQKEWDPKERIKLAEKLAKIAVNYAANENITDHFLIRVFNTEALGVIDNSTVTSDDIVVLKQTLKPYWNDRVKRLVYSDEARDRLSDFFEGSSV